MIKTYRLIVFDIPVSQEFSEEEAARQYVEKDAEDRGVSFESVEFILVERINHVDRRIKASHPGMRAGVDKTDVWYGIYYGEDDPEGRPIYVEEDDDCG